MNPPIAFLRTTLKLSRFPNITHPKPALLYPLPNQRLLQLPWRLKHVLLGQHPRPPMHTQRLPTLCIDEDIHAILGICMYVAEHETRLVRANGDETQVEGAAVLPDLREGGADREMCEIRTIVVDILRERRDGTVTCVSEMVISRV